MGDAGLRVGDLVDGKYQILELLGTGGMSNVWLARDRRLEKLWAVKEIRPNTLGATGEHARQALLDEASFMKRLDHPAIPRIVDVVDTGATTYVVMDYVEGRSLAARMRLQGTPFSQQEVLDWGIQLCDVLAYLHGLEHPVVYRDLKPANVIVREDGSVRLIDFGVAVELNGQGVSAPAVGTPGYAAPEQLPQSAGDAVAARPAVPDVRSDIYSLGATLYSLASGHTPKRAGDGGDGYRVDFSMRPLRVVDPCLSEGLERIVLRATRPDPEERYQTVREMRYDLAHHEELTGQWRESRRGRVRLFRRQAAGAGVFMLVGILCLCAGGALRNAGYADLLHEAQTASAVASADGLSPAESLYTSAISLEPGRVDAYRGLLRTYTSDGCLDGEEAARWQKACGAVRALARDPGYASLCYEVGLSYLGFFGSDQVGGAVGNAALISMGAAAPWFERAVSACEARRDASVGLSEAELRDARAYLIIARFHENAVRAGREGTGGEQAYRDFWDALAEALGGMGACGAGQRCPDGVMARLCQTGAEVMASPTYLAAAARAGIGRTEAEALADAVRVRADELAGFAASPQYGAVFGPVLAEVRDCLDLVPANVEAVYGNPVASLGAAGAVQAGTGIFEHVDGTEAP